MKEYTVDQLEEILAEHKRWLYGKGGKKADLRSADLRSADLSYANLRSADLSYADLSYANLRYADLSYADLRSAVLRSAVLRYADLRYADLSYADLDYADLRYADLRYADLDYAEWPLWCGSKAVKVNIKLVNQILAHVFVLDCNDKSFNQIKKAIVKYAKKSHRAKDLGVI